MPNVYSYHHFIDREADLQPILEIAKALAEGQPVDERVYKIADYAACGKTWLLYQLQHRLLSVDRVLPVFIRLDRIQNFWPRVPSKDLVGILIKLIFRQINYLTGGAALKDVFPGEGLHDMSRHLATKVGEILPNYAAVFIFDEIDASQQELLDALEDYLLSFLTGPWRTLIVLAGRNVNFRWKNYAIKESEIHNLTSFTIDETADQLARAGGHLPLLPHDLQSWSLGSPGFNDLILREAQHNHPAPITELEAIQACNRELLKGVPARLISIITALSVLSGFSDQVEELGPILQTYTPSGPPWTGKRCTQLFKDLLKINIGQHPLVRWKNTEYAIDENVRKRLERELQLRDPDLWLQMHCCALDLYRNFAHQPYGGGYWEVKVAYYQVQIIQGGKDPIRDCCK